MKMLPGVDNMTVHHEMMKNVRLLLSFTRCVQEHIRKSPLISRGIFHRIVSYVRI